MVHDHVRGVEDDQRERRKENRENQKALHATISQISWSLLPMFSFKRLRRLHSSNRSACRFAPAACSEERICRLRLDRRRFSPTLRERRLIGSENRDNRAIMLTAAIEPFAPTFRPI